jgi:hypothetical protein
VPVGFRLFQQIQDSFVLGEFPTTNFRDDPHRHWNAVIIEQSQQSFLTLRVTPSAQIIVTEKDEDFGIHSGHPNP